MHNIQIKLLAPGKLLNKTAITAINNLLIQLSSRSKKVSIKEIKDVLKQKNLKISIAYDVSNKKIVGLGTVYHEKTLMGASSRIEDVVVDKNFRGLGLGEAITKRLIKEAKKTKFSVLELTSGHHRQAANRLYKKLGFQKINTNTYRL